MDLFDIEVVKNIGKNKSKSDYYPLKEIKQISNSNDLFLVKESKMGVGSGLKEHTFPFYEIYKVQFIAVCKIEIADSLLIAFFIAEEGELLPFVLGGFPNNFYQAGNRFLVVDYKSYCEICSLTGEKKSSISEYIDKVKKSPIGVNALLNYDGKYLNFDEQQKLYKEVEKIPERE